MAPKLLIGTRFGLGINDPTWFEHRLELLSAVTVPSLAAQEDQGFEWVIFHDSAMPEDLRESLEQALAPFDGRAFLEARPSRRTTAPRPGPIGASMLRLAGARGLVDPDGFILTGRIDDDDAWSTDTVGEVRRRVGGWLGRREGCPGMGLTFEDGLTWVMYDMRKDPSSSDRSATNTLKAVTHTYSVPFASLSGFVCASVSDGLTSYSHKHSGLPDLLGKRGFAVDFIATAEPMWLYCRHKHANTTHDRRMRDAVNVTVSVNELAARFGLDTARTERYISRASTYGQVRFNPLSKNLRFGFQAAELEKQIEEAEASGADSAPLRLRREQLVARWSEEMAGVVGDPDEVR